MTHIREGLRMSHVVADQAFCPVFKGLLQTEVKIIAPSILNTAIT